MSVHDAHYFKTTPWVLISISTFLFINLSKVHMLTRCINMSLTCRNLHSSLWTVINELNNTIIQLPLDCTFDILCKQEVN